MSGVKIKVLRVLVPISIDVGVPLPKVSKELKLYQRRSPTVDWIGTVINMRCVGDSFFADSELFSAKYPSLWFANIVSNVSASPRIEKQLGRKPELTYRLVEEKGRVGIRIWRTK